MPEPFSAEQLNQLRQRWERDPKSRTFLQLAEEYSRAGRLSDAAQVLQAGLKEHPTYLSAQVALGRCLVQSGDPGAAVEILERAVARDPTQLVANKLLVEAYLGQGEPAKARERLDLYKLFNDRDPEIQPLEARIRAREHPPAAAVVAQRRAPHEPPGSTLFDLPVIESLPEVNLESTLGTPRDGAGTSSGEPFGALYPWSTVDVVRRIESAFAEQGIFVLAPAFPETLLAPAVAAIPEIPEIPTVASIEAVASLASLASVAAIPVASPVAAITESAEFAAEEVAPVEWESASWSTASSPSAEAVLAPPAPLLLPPPPPLSPQPTLPISEAPRPASATLGELYLAQGHFDEAEESFQSVLHARPGDAAALAGLESVRLQRSDGAAAFSDEPVVADEPNLIVGGLTARKAALLKDYLARIRRGAKRHVS